MPNVTNVTLQIQPGGGTTGSNNRTVTVTFTTTFNTTEQLAGVVFKADAVIRSVDDPHLSAGTPIGSVFIKAVAGTTTKTLTKVLTRAILNEDDDHRPVGNPREGEVQFVEDPDEWLATVSIAPAIFGSATRNSDQVIGSWGPLGATVPATPVLADPPNTN